MAIYDGTVTTRGATNGTTLMTNDARLGSAGTFNKTQKVTYGASVASGSSGGNVVAWQNIFQAGAHATANKIENLREIYIRNIGNTAI